jgi:hypothetical protein
MSKKHQGGPEDIGPDGQPFTQAYFVIRAAQEREELQREVRPVQALTFFCKQRSIQCRPGGDPCGLNCELRIILCLPSLVCFQWRNIQCRFCLVCLKCSYFVHNKQRSIKWRVLCGMVDTF